ncbi:hypothetical protein HYC85_007856 [Camellia sinensis]|uniref:SET domain-containing protein n=1 Tax=Camellia sinensis TaxID=4442 RepID=A0A7J7HQ55_CAMSI|nr:hypothetical protein HYC85_007856 [Camellia sinensis]
MRPLPIQSVTIRVKHVSSPHHRASLLTLSLFFFFPLENRFMTTHRFPLFLSLNLLLLFFPSLSLKPLPSSTLSVPTQICNLLFDSMPILITASLLASPPDHVSLFLLHDNEPCKSLVAPCISGTEVLVGALKSFSIVESSEHRDDKGKDKVKFDNAFEIKCPDTICSSPPRRSSQRTKLNEKTQTRKGGRKCGRTVMRKPLLDSVPFGVARKRRNFCKPAPIYHNFLSRILVLMSIKTEHTKSRNARGVQGIGKHSKNQVGASSQRSKRKKIATSGRIRLKVTLRKEVGQSFLPNIVSITGNGLGNDWGTNSEVPKLTDGSENKLKEEGPRINGFQFCNGDLEKAVSNTSNVCLANKDLESPVIYENSDGITADNHQRLPSEIEVEGLGVAFDNRYVDSGTSPDSEVINLITETQVNGKVQEDLKDALISSQACCVAPEDFTSLDLSQMRNKKGKKKDKLFHAGNFSVGDRLPSQEILNKASVLEKWGQGEKMGDGSYSSEASISTATANVSGNTSSSEGVSREPLPSSRITDFGVSCENLKAESGTEEDICFRLGVGLESPESHISENLLPNSKAKGWKHFKSSKPRGMSKSGSEVSDSPRSQSGNACGQKGNPVKSVSRKKVKDKGASNEVVSKVENHQETGDHSLDNPGKPKTRDEIITKDIFNLSMVPRDAGKQGLMPRSAWVCCDDCLKWRRILANLADSIEETNCRWTCMDNIDKGFSDCSIPQEKSNAEINAELEISDEEDAYDALYSKRLEPKHSTVQEQSSWMLIKSNLFLHRSRKSQTIDEIMVCHCKPRPDGRMMGCGDGCLNRMLNIECVKGTCPCGQRCSNQQFQKHKYAKLRWFRCGMKGYGLQLLEDISEGQFLIEYVGEVLDMQAYEARQREYAAKGHKHFYFMTLNGSEVIDACAKGNLGRFINHSCDPNCRTEKSNKKHSSPKTVIAMSEVTSETTSTPAAAIPVKTSNSHSVQITTIRLNGKIGYITGDKKAPAVNDPLFDSWDAENSMDLDIFNTYEWKSVDDCNHHKKTVEDSRIYKFLAGLNIEFDEVRGRIIGRPPLPSIGEVFAEVRREESRRSVMLKKRGTDESIEISALISDAAANKAANYQRRFDDKPRVWCDFCNKPRHTRETCWKIHGKPVNWKSSKQGEKNRGFPTANEADSGPFNKEQIDQLLKLIKSNSSSGPELGDDDWAC